jgi:hypothetical protein
LRKINLDYVYNPQTITTQVLTFEGDLWECNHAGAEEVTIEFDVMETVPGTFGQLAPTGSRDFLTIECDKCHAWLDYDGLWRKEE